MEEEDTYLWARPVHITASRCGSIVINVKFEINAGDDPALRALAEQLLGRAPVRKIDGSEE